MQVGNETSTQSDALKHDEERSKAAESDQPNEQREPYKKPVLKKFTQIKYVSAYGVE